MKKNTIECLNCHLPNELGAEKCIYCGATITVKEEVQTQEAAAVVVEKKKRKFAKHELFFLGSAGLGILIFLLFLLPAEGSGTSLYKWAFNSAKTASNLGVQIGINAPVIAFIFAIIGILNHWATLVSLRRKTTEISLFANFTTFYYIIIAIVSFLSPIQMANGTNSHFTMGIGFILVGILSLAIAGLEIFANILYKKYLVNNPLESFKGQ